MAKYTLNLSEVCEQVTGMSFNDMPGMAFDRIDTIANAAIPKLFSARYTLLDGGNDRIDLLRMIIEHYWEYEVCAYTPSDFILRLNRKLNEIAPYYNKRYESTKLDFPVFDDVDYQTDGNDKIDDNTVDHATGNTINSGTDTTTANKTGTDRSNNTEGGTTSTATDVTEEDKGHDVVHDDFGEGYHATANLDPMKTNWDYNNETPQGSISGIKDTDYLSSYAKHTSEQANTTAGFAPSGKHVGFSSSEGDGYTANKVDIVAQSYSGNNGSHGATSQANSSKDHTAGTSVIDNDTTITHGKTDDYTITYGNQVKTDLKHGHVIDTTDDATKKYGHVGEDHKHVQGKANSGRSYSEMLNLYRSTMINIYNEIIEELHELFFLIY